MKNVALLAFVFGSLGLYAEEAENQEISMSERSGCRPSAIRSIVERDEYYQEDPYTNGDDSTSPRACDEEKPCNKGTKRKSAAQAARGE